MVLRAKVSSGLKARAGTAGAQMIAESRRPATRCMAPFWPPGGAAQNFCAEPSRQVAVMTTSCLAFLQPALTSDEPAGTGVSRSLSVEEIGETSLLADQVQRAALAL